MTKAKSKAAKCVTDHIDVADSEWSAEQAMNQIVSEMIRKHAMASVEADANDAFSELSKVPFHAIPKSGLFDSSGTELDFSDCMEILKKRFKVYAHEECVRRARKKLMQGWTHTLSGLFG